MSSTPSRRLHAIVSTIPASERRRAITERVLEMVVRFLGFDEDEEIAPDEGFVELGFDSLRAVDFKLLLEEETGLTFATTALFECPTPNDLVDLIERGFDGERGPTPRAAGPRADTAGDDLDDAALAALPHAELVDLARRRGDRLAAAHEPIAIVGISCRFPGGARDVDGFLDLQLAGRDAVGEVPPSRWPIERFFDPDPAARGMMYTRRGGFLDDIDQFDGRFFNISPREATQLDPQQRVLLELVWESIEDASIAPSDLRGRSVGVFVGTRGAEYYQGQTNWTVDDADIYYATGNAVSTMAGRIAFWLGLTGPCYALDTACSSSLVALHEACRSLRSGESDAALAAGINLLLDPFGTVAICKAQMLSPDGRCKSFDARADGYVRSEGGGVVLLKRLSDARRDGDRIRAVVRGTAINQDGASSGLTVPNRVAQEQVIRLALRDARLEPGDIDVVEAHGTGTSLGDPIEVGALDDVFTPGRDRPLLVGSVKTNVGHCEPAAGFAGIAKMVAALERAELPALLGFEEPNPHVDWERSVVALPKENMAWPTGPGPRRCGISSFGFSGTNGHVVLEQAPSAAGAQESDATPAPRSAEALLLSAPSADALDTVVAEVRRRVANDDAPDLLANLCSSYAVGRARFGERLALTTTSRADLLERLDAIAEQGVDGGAAHAVAARGRAGSQAPRVAFLFTGQGSQWAGMARELFDTAPVFRAALLACDERLAAYLGTSLLPVLYGERMALLDRTDFTQPAIFAVQVALTALWRSFGVEPSWVAGHSIGEYAAAHAAGVLSLDDACRLVAARGRLMVEHTTPGDMLAVFADADAVTEQIGRHGDRLAVAALNCDARIVLSGSADAIADARGDLESRGVRVEPLSVSHAFHSPLMEPMLAAFGEVARSVTYEAPRTGFVSCLDPGVLGGGAIDADYWVRHVREPVRFREGMGVLAEQGCDAWIEIGPNPVLLGMARRFVEDDELAWLPSLREGDGDWKRITESVGELYARGAPIDGRALAAGRPWTRVSLPRTPLRRERYWLPPRSERSVRSGGHPLVGAPLELSTLAPGEALFEGEVSAVRPAFLADHRAFDEALFPGAGYVEQAHAALRGTFGTEAFELLDVAFRSAMPLGDEPRRVQVHVERDEDAAGRAARFTLMSSDDPATGDWTTHATGRARVVDDTAHAQRIDLDAARARCTDELPVQGFYDHCIEVGLAYGPAFEGLRRLVHGSDAGAREVVAEIALPESVAGAPEAREFAVHPALLDNAFQAAGSLTFADWPDDLFLPVGVERIDVVDRGPRARAVMVARQRPAADGGWSDERRGATLDVDLVDEDGHLLVRASGLRLVATSRDALIAQGDPLRTLGTVQNFVERELASDDGTIAVLGSWCVIGDGAVADALADGLGAAGARVARDVDTALTDGAPDGVVVVAADLEREDAEPARALAPLLAASRALDAADARATRLVAITRGALDARSPTDGDASQRAAGPNGGALVGFLAALAREKEGWRPKVIDLDPRTDADATRAILRELAANDDEWRVALRGDARSVARLTTLAAGRRSERSRLSRPAGAREVALRAQRYGSLDALALVPAAQHPCGPNQIAIGVDAASLNFKDVLYALGMLNEHGAAAEAADQPLGLECAGRVVEVGADVTEFAVGDRVVTGANGALATRVVVDALGAVPIPDTLTSLEAATLPTASMTALWALEHLAALRQGETILVHAASGGVGHAAVGLARRLGATVIATASEKKRDHVRALGVEHVFDSRSTDFEDQVLAVTDGRGVDVVLNCLTGDAIPASLRALAPNGRFCEIGKIGVWSADEVAALRGDVRYHLFDMADVLTADLSIQRRLLTTLVERLDAGEIAPPPIRRFALDEAKDAFGLLARAQHIGKVVLDVAATRSATTLDETGRPRLRPDGTYLVTGGLGSLGLATARRLAELGAGALVLCGRRAPDDDARAALAEIEALGARVATESVDVSDAAAVDALVHGIGPSLAGVVHAAGVLDDGLLAGLDDERVAHVLAPKALGAWNLHRATRGRSLDLFVLYSSMSALVGNAGQAPYAAANAFLDALAAERRAQGLAALSIGWGPWSEGGMAARLGDRERARLAEQGLSTIAPEVGLDVLESLIARDGGPSYVGVLPVHWPRYVAHLSSAPPLLEALASGATAKRRASEIGEDEIRAELLALAPEERAPRLEFWLRHQLASVMGFASADDVAADQAFVDMGIDSLLAVDLRNRLESALRTELPVTFVFDHPDVASLAQALADLPGEGDVAEELDDALLAEIADLSEDEVLRRLGTDTAGETDGALDG